MPCSLQSMRAVFPAGVTWCETAGVRGVGGSLYLWCMPVRDNFLQVWSGPAHLLHRSSGTSTLCSLRVNWLIL